MTVACAALASGGPQTRIVAAPPVETFARHAVIRFDSPSAEASFECRLDAARWRPCRSPLRTPRLAGGRHVLRVRAVADGVVDRTPAAAAFRVVRHAEVIGHSAEGRAIEALRLGDPAAERTALVVGVIHGDETQGRRIVGRLRDVRARRLGSVDLWLVADLNPDGTARHTRGNAHRVDLNRNFAYAFDPDLGGGYFSGPHPFSEPETRAARELSRRIRPDVAIWYHQPWGRTLVPCGREAHAARVYARRSGLDVRGGCDRDLPGSAINWQYHRLGTDAFVVELPGQPLHAAELRRHVGAAIAVARGV